MAEPVPPTINTLQDLAEIVGSLLAKRSLYKCFPYFGISYHYDHPTAVNRTRCAILPKYLRLYCSQERVWG